MSTLSYPQIEGLWIANGGKPALAPVMAAIALAESGGDTSNLNDTPATGDYSVGLWQINYYNGLLNQRSGKYGSPAQLFADPNRQAKAAIDLAGNGDGLGNWTTYTSGKYKQYLDAGAVPVAPGAAGMPGQQQSSSNPCLISWPSQSLPIVGNIGGGCLLQGSKARAIVGALSLVGGGLVMLIGVNMLIKGVGPGDVLKSISKTATGAAAGSVAGPEGTAAGAAAGAASGRREQSEGQQRRTLRRIRREQEASPSFEELDENLSLERREAEARDTATRAPRTTAGGRRMIGRSEAA